jgi:uncharacterized protein (DUF1778 family)
MSGMDRIPANAFLRLRINSVIIIFVTEIFRRKFSEMTMPKVLRYEMQWDEETYALAERAARAAGLTSIKAYVTQLVNQHAPEVLEAYSSIQLTNAQFDAFCEACDNPPAPTAKLRKAARALDQEGLVLNADR